MHKRKDIDHAVMVAILVIATGDAAAAGLARVDQLVATAINTHTLVFGGQSPRQTVAEIEANLVVTFAWRCRKRRE